MKVIDAHFHYSKIKSFEEIALNNCIDYTKVGFLKECKDNNIVAGVSMGLTETNQGLFPDNKAINPMLCDLAELPENFYFCTGINPLDLDIDSIKKIKNACENSQCVGLKIYAGYYHYYLADKIYNQVYAIAKEYNLPIVIHSGDTFSKRGLLKYSHPLQIDELAVLHPEIRFVIAHLGNPWLIDTAEIIYKNENVYADLSGLLEGDKGKIKRFSSQELFINMYKTALILADRYDKLIYGSDWPIVPMNAYINFIKQTIPEKHYNDVFYNNALNIFQRLKIKNNEGIYD